MNDRKLALGFYAENWLENIFIWSEVSLRPPKADPGGAMTFDLFSMGNYIIQ